MARRLIIIISIFALTIQVQAQDSWKKDIENMLYEFLQCNPDMPTSYPCNVFTSKALMRIYGINDFINGDQHFTANQIYNFIILHPDLWTLLGNASSQDALNQAQGYANLGKAVIAVLKNENGPGHVAIIIPGELGNSSNWGLNVPNSASFFLNKPNKSYVGKNLSYAFSASEKVKVFLYGRNYN
jgi:hypothetical protein